MSSEIIKKTAEYVRQKLLNEPTGHDWFHVERVWRLAKYIQKEEGGDRELVELSALLHDLGDYKQYAFNETKGSLILHGMMDILDIDEDLQEKIIKNAIESQYYGDETKPASTLEGRIVQDADWLDSLGAIGIARVFATGGNIKRVIYDPERKSRQKLSKREYQTKKQEGTSYNYFHEKILKLPKLLNTKMAKKIAANRVKFVENFLKQFKDEWEGNK